MKSPGRLRDLASRIGLPEDLLPLIQAADSGEGEVKLKAERAAATLHYRRVHRHQPLDVPRRVGVGVHPGQSLFAVQLAKLLGTGVIATTGRADKEQRLRDQCRSYRSA